MAELYDKSCNGSLCCFLCVWCLCCFLCVWRMLGWNNAVVRKTILLAARCCIALAMLLTSEWCFGSNWSRESVYMIIGQFPHDIVMVKTEGDNLEWFGSKVCWLRESVDEKRWFYIFARERQTQITIRPSFLQKFKEKYLVE